MYRFLSQNFAISQKMLWRPLGGLTRFEAFWSEINQFLVNITLLHLWKSLFTPLVFWRFQGYEKYWPEIA